MSSVCGKVVHFATEEQVEFASHLTAGALPGAVIFQAPTPESWLRTTIIMTKSKLLFFSHCCDGAGDVSFKFLPYQLSMVG